MLPELGKAVAKTQADDSEDGDDIHIFLLSFICHPIFRVEKFKMETSTSLAHAKEYASIISVP